MRRAMWVPALAMLLVANATPTVADHRPSDERPPTPFVTYQEHVVRWLALWIDVPDTEVRQGPAAFTAVALTDELRYIRPEPCYLDSYAAYWGLVPTLEAINDAPSQQAYELTVERFRSDLARATELTALDAVECGPAEAAGAEGHTVTPSPPSYQAVVEMDAAPWLRFVDEAGMQLESMAVSPGETVLIRVDNTSGFGHSFYIGTEEELESPGAATDVGIAAWNSGTRELAWTVPLDVTGLLFACTVPGHFALMHGQIVVAE